MNLKRLKEIPKLRLMKKIIGYDEIYSIAIRHKGDSILNNNEAFELIKNTTGIWYADPILFQWEGNDYLFVEAYDRKRFRGYICVANIKNIKPDKIIFEKVIEENYHMSFPMVFVWHDKIYMIPETSGNYSINLYEAIDFPIKWKRIQAYDTKNKRYVDTVVIDKNMHRIVLLTSEYKDDNPIMVRYQRFYIEWENLDALIPDEEYNKKQEFNYFDRNAGMIYECDGISYLPTQFSTNIDYGVGLQIRKEQDGQFINVLNINAKDLNIRGIRISDIVGIHSFCCSDSYEIIDIRYMKFSPFYQFLKIRR